MLSIASEEDLIESGIKSQYWYLKIYVKNQDGSKHFDLQDPNNLKEKNILGSENSELGEMKKCLRQGL